MQSPHGQVAAQTIARQLRGEDITETFAIATHGATSSLQMPLNQDWVLAVENTKSLYADSRQRSRLRFYAVQESTVPSQVPAVRVVCLSQDLATGTSSVAFPAVPKYELAIDSGGQVLRNYTVFMNSTADGESNDFHHSWSAASISVPTNQPVS